MTKKSSGKKWTPQEVQYLKENYSDTDKDTLLKNLPGRSWNSIALKVQHIGVMKADFWTEADKNLLRNHYVTDTKEELFERFPGRTWDGIQLKANRSGAGHRHKGGENAWPEAEKQYVQDNYTSKTREEILEALPGRSWEKISKIAHRLGVAGRVKFSGKGGHPWQQWEDDYIIKNYITEKRDTMLKALPDRTWVAIKDRARTHLNLNRPVSVGRREYDVNHDYFKVWTQDMAYILGFIYADGCITKTERKNIDCPFYRISITQKEPDILIEIAKTMEYTGRINRREDERWGRILVTNRLDITSRTMFYDLIECGVTPRKSLTMKFPEHIPKKYTRDFIRGEFDGDGCVRVLSKWHLDCSFVSGSEEFLIVLSKVLHEQAKMTLREVKNTKPGENYFVLRYNKDDQEKLYRWMYHKDMGELYLKRKKVIFDSKFGNQLTKQ